MKNLFSKNFSIESANLVSVSGIGGNAALIHLLSQESVSAGFRVLVLSTCKQRYPIEGKVLISDETDLLFRLIRSEDPEITYLAKQVAGDLLAPFEADAIHTLLEQCADDVRLFINHDLSEELPAGYEVFFSKAHRICTLNFNTLRDKILEIYKNTAIRSSASAQKKIQKEFLRLIKENCPDYAQDVINGTHILFIDQVKNVLDENLLIPVARSLSKFKVDKVLYGYVHHYQVKAI